MGGPDTQKSVRIKYQKRAKTLKSRAHDLADICGARVYLFIEHERECFVYKSVDDTLWPPPDGLLEMYYNGLERKSFQQMQKSTIRNDKPNCDTPEWLHARWEHLCNLEKLHRDMIKASDASEQRDSGSSS